MKLYTIGILLALAASFARGDTLYWDGSGTTWNTASAWSTVETGESPLTADDASYDPAAIPGSADDVVFGADTVTVNQSLNLSGVSQAAHSITFSNTTGLTYAMRRSTGTGGSSNLTIGDGGVSVAAGSGAVTIGNSSSTIAVRFGASQTWTNNSSYLLYIRNNAAAADAVSTPITWTLSCTGSGGISDAGALNDSTGGGSVRVVVDSSGTGVVSLSGGNWSGGTFIKSGRLSTKSTGPGDILLGDTQGSADATLSLASSAVVNGTVIVQAGNTGTMVLNGNTTATLGGVTLNKDLTIDNQSVFVFSGAITGSGSITKSNSGTMELRGQNTLTGDVFVDGGTLNLSNIATNGESTGSMRFTVTDGGSNRIYGDSTVLLDGTFVLDLSGVTASTGSWSLVDTATLNETFGDNFNIVDQAGLLTFTESAGVWTSNDEHWTFDESSGTLTAVPEPASLSGLMLSGALLLRRRRRG